MVTGVWCVFVTGSRAVGIAGVVVRSAAEVDVRGCGAAPENRNAGAVVRVAEVVDVCCVVATEGRTVGIAGA